MTEARPGGWQPTPRDGRVRIGLSGGQKLRWTMLTAIVAAVAGGAGLAAARPALVVAVGVMVAVSLAYARLAGVELGPTTITVVAPSLRRRTLWTRTVRWTTVIDIRATGTGEIWLALPGEPPLVLRAPRGQWLGADRDFAAKLHLIDTWWQVNSAAALRETSSTPYERVREFLDRGADPRAAARPGPAADPFASRAPSAPAERHPQDGHWVDPMADRYDAPDEGWVDPAVDHPVPVEGWVDPGSGWYVHNGHWVDPATGRYGAPVEGWVDPGSGWYVRDGHWVDPAADRYDAPMPAGTWPDPVSATFTAVAPAPTRPTDPSPDPATGTAPPDPAAPVHPLEPDDEGERAPFPLVAMVGFFLVAAGVGYLLIGADVVVLAIALLVLLRFGRDPGRPLAMGAFALLVLAAVSTVAQPRPNGVTLAFATEAPLAAEAGAVIGVFLVVSTIIFIATERSGPRAIRRNQGGVDRIHLATLWAVLPAWVRAAVAYVMVALGSLAIRLILAPPALSPGYQPLLANLRLGTGYSLASPSGGTPVGDLPPLAPVLVAYSPLGPKVALLVVSILTVIGVGWVAHQRWGRAAGIMAAAFAAVLPALWGEQLPMQLAALLLLAGVALADPREVTTRRAVLAGACLGLATLARPDAVVAVVVVALWMSRQREGQRSPVVALVVAAVAAVLPWATFVWSEFGSPWLTSSLPATFNDPMTVTRLPSTVKVAVSAVFVAMLVAAVIRFWSQRGALLPFLVLPFVCLALALTEPLRRDPLAWSAALAAVVLGRWAAEIVRGQLGPVLEVRYRDVVDWDIVFEEQERKRGYGGGAWRSDAETPFEQEPEEDRLFR